MQGLLQNKQQPQVRLPVRVAKLLMEQPYQDQPNLELLVQLVAQMEMSMPQPPALPSMQLMFQELLSVGKAREA